MTPFILPAMLDFSTDPLTLTPGSYSELVADTYGDADPDTDQDLAAADDAALLVSGAENDDGGTGDLLGALGGVQSSIVTNAGGQIGAQIGPAITAAGGHLNDYEGIVGPAINPTSPTPPPNQPPQGPVGSGSQPCVTDPSAEVLPAMTTDQQPYQEEITDSQSEGEDIGVIHMVLACADTDIFSLQKTQKLIGISGYYGDTYTEVFSITATPAKVGTFTATVLEEYNDGTPTLTYYYSVTVKPGKFVYPT